MKAASHVSGLLDRMAVVREQHEQTDLVRAYARRGGWILVPLLLLLLLFRRGSGSDSKALHFYVLIGPCASNAACFHRPQFNAFLTRQQAEPGNMKLTLATADATGSAKSALRVVLQAQDVRQVRPLTAAADTRACPPSVCPGPSIEDSLSSLVELAGRASPHEQVVVAVFADGGPSPTDKLAATVQLRREAGWAFALMGTHLNAHAFAAALHIPAGCTSNFAADARGLKAAWVDLGAAVSRARQHLHSGIALGRQDRAHFLEGFTSAERDYALRKLSGGGRGAARGGAGGVKPKRRGRMMAGGR